MAIKDALIAELKHEGALTRKMLERVPMDRADWKPHNKSMPIGGLATHIADTVNWVSRIVNFSEFDLFKDYSSKYDTAPSSAVLLEFFDANLNEAITNLESKTDEELNAQWALKRGEKAMRDMPKKVAIRGFAFSHLIHHRGQLSVYLRLLDVPVPGMYGPSADEM